MLTFSDFLLKNLKPFSLEEAKEGKPVCTRDGRKARIICFDRISGDELYKIVACVTAFDGVFEEVLSYRIDGYIVDSQNPKNEDLMMLPEKKEGWVHLYFSDFILFLYTEKCLINYFDNINNDEFFGAKDNIRTRIKLYMMSTPSDFLESAFKWDISPEGYNFWADINNKWKWFINHER